MKYKLHRNVLRKGGASRSAFIRKEKFWAQISEKAKKLKVLKEIVRCVSEQCLEYGNEDFRPQRPRSFWSALRTTTSGNVQHWKSAIHRLPFTPCMLRTLHSLAQWCKGLQTKMRPVYVGPLNRSDQPKIKRLENNYARLILRRKLNGTTTW